MNIPPFLKVSSNLLRKIAPRSSSLLKPTRSEILQSQTHQKIDSAQVNDRHIARTHSLNPLESLLTLNLDDSVYHIYCFLTQLPLSAPERLKFNLEQLSNEVPEAKTLRSKDIKMLTHRILSFEDHLTQEQASNLIFALTNSDRRFSPLVSHLFTSYLKGNNTHSGSESLDGRLYSHFIVLSSLLIFKRNLMENKRRLAASSQDKQSPSSPDISTNFEELESKFLSNLESAITSSKCDLNNEEVLLFLRTLSLSKVSNKSLSTFFFDILKPEEMTLAQLCTMLHTYSLLGISDSSFDRHIKMALERVASAIDTGVELPDRVFPQLFHFFYETGNLEHELFNRMATILAERNPDFRNQRDFYRVVFPLALSNQLSRKELGKWALNHLATDCDLYIKDVSKFLFVLTSLGGCVRVEGARRKPGSNLDKVELETDIYERALMYLNESEKGSYFPSERAALLYLFERTMDLVEVCDQDQFVQLIQAMTNRLVKTSPTMKLRLLNECRKRVNTVSVGGILHILQFVVWIHGNKNPDCVAILSTYMERILADVTTFNVGDHSLLHWSRMYVDSFLTEPKELANVLYFMDWAGINSPDLAREVGVLVSASNYQLIARAELRDLSHIIHYIALSNADLDVLDPLYIAFGQRLRDSGDLHPRDLIMVLESMIVNAAHTRHRNLLKEIERKALELSGPISTMDTLSSTLSRLTQIDYTFKDNGTRSFIVQLNP